MPNGNDKLRRMYERALEDMERGYSMQEVNAAIKKATNGKVLGFASLEIELGIGDRVKGRGTMLRESVANILDKVGLGWGGEIRGAVRGIGAELTGGDFGETFQEEQAKFDELVAGAKETSPTAAAIGAGAGFGANAALLTAMLPLNQGTIAARAAAPLRRQMLGGLVRGAPLGAVGGALEGAGHPGERGGRALTGAMFGAGAGAGLGLVLPAAAAGLGAGASKLFGGQASAERKATGLLSRALRRAKVKPEALPEVMQELPRFGPAQYGEGSVIADISPSLARSARAARNVAPDLDDARGPVEAIATRAEGRGERIMSGLRSAADLPEGYAPEAIFQAQRQEWLNNQLKPLLQNKNPIQIVGLNDLAVANPEVKRALRKGGAVMDLLDGPQRYERIWAAREELLHRAHSPNLNGFQRDKVYEGITRLTQLMEEQAPGTRAMLARYRHMKAVEGAFEMGEQVGSKSSRELELMLEQVKNNEEQLNAFKQGLAAWYEKQLEQTGTGGPVATKLMRLPPRTREHLRALFGDARKMNEFIEQELIGRERRWDILNAALRGNSTTAQQLSDIEQIMTPARAPTIRTLWDRIWMSATTNIDFSKEVAYEFGRLLMTDLKPQQVRRITDTMVALAQQQGMTARGMPAVGAAAAELPSLLDYGNNEEGNGLLRR